MVDCAVSIQRSKTSRISVQVEVANARRVGSIFGLLERLLKLLFQQVGRMLLRFDGLAEQRFFAFFLLPHRTGGVLHIRKRLRRNGRRVPHNGVSLGVYLDKGATTGACNLEIFAFSLLG